MYNCQKTLVTATFFQLITLFCKIFKTFTKLELCFIFSTSPLLHLPLKLRQGSSSCYKLLLSGEGGTDEKALMNWYWKCGLPKGYFSQKCIIIASTGKKFIKKGCLYNFIVSKKIIFFLGKIHYSHHFGRWLK